MLTPDGYIDRIIDQKIERYLRMYGGVCVHDLRVYADASNGSVYHYHDEKDNEVDAVIEFKDGSYAAFEIKLSDGSIKDAVKSLVRFRDNVEKKPVFSCIIVGHQEAVIRAPKSGIYIVPLTSLKP